MNFYKHDIDFSIRFVLNLLNLFSIGKWMCQVFFRVVNLQQQNRFKLF